MIRTINLLVITLLLALSAHAEVKTSIPDFSKSISTSLTPVEVELAFNNIAIHKHKLIDEHGPKIFSILPIGTTLPVVGYFEKKTFVQLIQNYRSRSVPNFYLII